jgi:tetraacyldisaccharide 4'-kinase
LNPIRRVFLYPFSWIYFLVIRFRHWLFDAGFFSSYHSKLRTICIGNLSFGGTGKTPHVEFVAKFFTQQGSKVAIVSRGYGRKTKGLREVFIDSSSTDVGDEPLQMKINLGDNAINLVCEKRADALRRLETMGSADVVLLDDALQHRGIACGLNILLTEYHHLFTDDFLFPAGSLRDIKSRAGKADVIIVTKCPDLIDRELVKTKLKKYSKAQVYFSHIKYSTEVKSVFTKEALSLESLANADVSVFSGIANEASFVNHIESICRVVSKHKFADHHQYSHEEIEKLFATTNHPIITTQKDAVRLLDFFSIKQIQSMPLYYLPIEISFDEKEKLLLTKLLNNYAR